MNHEKITRRDAIGTGLAGVAGLAMLGPGSPAAAQTNAPTKPGAPAKSGSVRRTAAKPYNVLFLLVDQESLELPPAQGYALPARERLRKRGISFRQHYIASAMCTPSRAALLSGTPPQVNGVFDQMEYPWTPSLLPTRANMASVMKRLGYETTYFGKFEMNKTMVDPIASVNYEDLYRPYGIDNFSAGGDTDSGVNSGYKHDEFIASEAVRYMRSRLVERPAPTSPFFLVASMVNPHDISWCDANKPGQDVQRSENAGAISPPPDNTIYHQDWAPQLPDSLNEDLANKAFPGALAEYREGWNRGLGDIPANQPDMWRIYRNYYLNLIQDSDRSLGSILDCLDELDLWRDTIVVFTADHGEMCGSHGGLRGKGPFAYDLNVRVPMVIAHPDFPGGLESELLTSHLDLLPTFAGFTGQAETARKEALRGAAGRDFSGLLGKTGSADTHASRPGALFNYTGLLTVDADFCAACLGSKNKPEIDLTGLKPHLNKRGLLSVACDGRYKFARYYAPDNFNRPTTLDDLFANNDVQLFDLKTDPGETQNLAMDRPRNEALLSRMNDLLNTLMDEEVGVNDGAFLPKVVRPA